MILIKLFIICLLSVFSLICQGEINSDDLNQSPLLSLEEYWEDNIKRLYFPQQNIISGEKNELIKLEAPYRAEDASVVPISIQTVPPEDKNITISKIYIFIDKNPSPLVGVFEFSKFNSKTDLFLRVRVNEYSYIRTIAETSDGNLYMAKSFVKASGGCSIPAIPSGGDPALLGRMQTRIMGKLALSKPNLLQLKIKHPNYSGLESSGVPGSISPEQNFIKNIRVHLNDKQVLNAELTFSISTNPSFRFYISPEQEGTLVIEAIDSDGNVFTHSHLVDNNNVSTAIPIIKKTSSLKN